MKPVPEQPKSKTPSPEVSKADWRCDLIGRLASSALDEMSHDAVLDAAVRAAGTGVSAELGAFFEIASKGDLLALRSGVGWPPGDRGRTTFQMADLIPSDWPQDEIEPRALPDVGSAGAELSFLREHGIVSGVVVRVRRGDSPYGLLGVYSRTRREFTPDDLRFLGSVGSIVSSAAGRWRRHRMMRESEARLAGIIASAMDAIIAVDEEQKVVLFNGAAEKIFQCPAAEAIGSPLDRFIPVRFREAHREHIRRFGASGVTERRMGRLDSLSGVRSHGEEFPIEASISHAEVGGKRVFTVIVRDISERRRLEEQLLHSQKLESVGRLAGGIAHDFNNVLTAVFGYVDLALAHVEPDGPARESLDTVQVAAQRAADLTSKLLAFARKQIIEPKVIDLNELINGVLGMATRLLGDDITSVVHQAPLLPNVRVDPGQFEHVLINLAVNARDAMPKGGKFIVETSHVTLDHEFAALHAELSAGPYVLLTVSDTGMGMDPVTLEHCFDPFYTTKRAGRGTGLGLSSTYGIVKQSGGHITAYSEKGRGTTFRIYLPACTETATPASATPGPAERSGSETILLVEDDSLVRGIAARSLRDCGYTVLEAADAEEAAIRAVQARDPIDLLLTDVVLPKASGRELAERLQQARPDLEVLYTSGFTDNVIEHHGVLAPGVAFLAKPYTPSMLAAKVRQVLDNPIRARPTL